MCDLQAEKETPAICDGGIRQVETGVKDTLDDGLQDQVTGC